MARRSDPAAYDPASEPARSETGDSWGAIMRDARTGTLGIFAPLLILIGVMWAVHVVNFFGAGWLSSSLGLRPRSLDGLVGVVFAPLLHGGWTHLIGNSVALLLLGAIAAAVTGRLLRITAAVWLLGTAVLWVIGTPGVHIGASILVYGFATFLVVYGWATRRPLPLLAALLVLAGYLVPFLVGLLPQSGISWTGHLAGAAGGVIAALGSTRQIRADREHRRALKYAKKLEKHR
ncbi:rhomboid family intramembrane serine protease [Nesterenkonia marinintestina]|uniref:rhomboid family intramembrane serine protease n=1 Tax=Nesterenkonia marinintestina TaxID=2979865 RepID=UPI0021C0B43C|nr:rhomboid family intramembrane serine protease [Nesterenkonia sp. GX14115]